MNALPRSPAVSFTIWQASGLDLANPLNSFTTLSTPVGTEENAVENSPIEWTDHTYNPWWGCNNVSPACDNCYAEEEVTTRWTSKVGNIWGKDAPRHFLSDAHWKEPLKWNRQAQREGVRKRVFCGSMCDVMEDRPDLIPHRERLWKLIEATPFLDWQLLTKRPQNFLRFLPKDWIKHPRQNVWLMTSVESSDYLWRVNALKACPAVVHGLSIEPLLAPIPTLTDHLTHIEWVIVGGESGRRSQPIRPMHPDWVRDIRDQCQAARVPFFFKQWGEHNSDLIWIGKKKAGRELDGRTWDEFPDPDLDQHDRPDPTLQVPVAEPESREESPIEGGVFIPSHAGDDLLFETEEFISQYIYLPDPEMHTLPLALYVTMTHCWEQVLNTVPYLMVSSPQRNMGKSVLLETLAYLSDSGEFVTEMSVASMFDLINDKRPALYLDEFEAYRKSREHLGIFNGGYRRDACVFRMRGKVRTRFDVFCPKAFGLVGLLHETLASRCIHIYMQGGRAPHDFDRGMVRPLAL